MMNCEKCPIEGKGKGRVATTKGCSNYPDIAFVGDFPRYEEVKRGGPLLGEAGKLLRSTLTELGCDLGKVYYTLACLCNTPKDKDPSATAIKACKERLLTDLAEVKPKIIVPLGNGATNAILGSGKGITKRRGYYEEVMLPGSTKTTMVVPTIHPAAVIKTPERFPDIVEDLEYILSILAGEAPEIQPPYENYVTVQTQEMFDLAIKRLTEVKEQGKLVVVDIETTGLNFLDGELLSIGFCWKRETALVIDWYALIKDNLDNLRKMQNALEGMRTSFQGGQYDFLWITHRGCWPKYEFDTMLAHYLLDERQGYHGLKRLAKARYRAPQYDSGVLNTERKVKTPEQFLKEEEIHTAVTPEEWANSTKKYEILSYNGADVDYQFRLTEDLSKEINEEGRLREVHDNILIPAAQHFVELERQGMLVDVPYLDDRDRVWSQELKELEEQMRSYPGAEDLNFRSPKQVSDFLFGTLGLEKMARGRMPEIDMDTLLEEISKIEDPEAQEYWKTQSSRTGQIKSDSTSTYMLYWLGQQHEFPRLMVRHRIVGRKKDAYCDGIRNAMWSDCRVRPNYRIHGTRTGRLSSSKPNIHGIPKLKEVKNVFMADPGYVIIAADYSQAEVRMMAHFANDKKLIDALHSQDIHTAIMKNLFNLTDKDMEDLPDGRKEFLRRAAKTITFGIIYGRGAKGLAPQIGSSVEEAEAYISAFFEMMPDVYKYIRRCHDKVMRDQFVETIYGNRRRFDLILKGAKANEVRRQAVNMPIQGSVSHMTLQANLRVMNRLEREGIEAYPWPHKHDEIMLQVPSYLVKPSIEIVAEEMADPGFDTDVPFISDIQVGRKWGMLKDVQI